MKTTKTANGLRYFTNKKRWNESRYLTNMSSWAMAREEQSNKNTIEWI